MAEPPVPMPPKVTLWLDPGCPRCQKARELLLTLRCEVEPYDFLQTPPTVEQLREVLALLQLRPADIVRKDEPIYGQLGLQYTDAEGLLGAMCSHPQLIDRPIALAPDRDRAVLARPVETVMVLLTPKAPAGESVDDLVRRVLQGKFP